MDDIEIRRVEKMGFAAQTLSFDEGDVSIVLDLDLDSDLLSKGLARDITRRVQAKRKELDLELESTIGLKLWVEGIELADSDWSHVKNETRAGTASLNDGDPHPDSESFEVDGTSVSFHIS